jgi:dihydrofolate synthase/folylpolyglutamate synthase
VTARDRLLALEAFGIKLGLDNIRTLLNDLDHPERACPTVHVAGTNGKGSVCAMVERGLRAAGHRTGLYTSPHLDRLEERVAIDGAPVATDRFDRAAADVLAAVDHARAAGRLDVTPTFFEVTTATAFEMFRRAGVEAAVVEVGLGGRFDATNVVQPVCTAVTSIAYDHERHLGSTLAAIAGEKAGIAKAGVPMVVGDLPDEAARVVARTTREVGAPLVDRASLVPGGLSFDAGAAIVRFATPVRTYPTVRLALLGAHQVANAAVAVRVLELADVGGVRVPAEAICTGLADARWPARMEWLRLTDGTLLIDAAHNPAGAAALASYLEDAGCAPLPVVLAVMRDKHVDPMVRALSAVASRFVAAEVDHVRSHRADALAALIAAAAPQVPVAAEPDAAQAVREAVSSAGRAVAAGSIYFVGPLRARLIEGGATSL